MESRLLRLIEPKIQLDSKRKVFFNASLMRMIVPLFFEQLLTMMVGIADTFMISYAGDAAVSGVSLVNMFVTIFIYLFTALAAGGAVVVSQYIGSGNRKNADCSAGQLLTSILIISIVLTGITLVWNRHLLQFLFRRVEPDVMDACVIYLRIMALSFPALAVYNAGAAMCRSTGRTDLTMKVSDLDKQLIAYRLLRPSKLSLQKQAPGAPYRVRGSKSINVSVKSPGVLHKYTGCKRIQ